MNTLQYFNFSSLFPLSFALTSLSVHGATIITDDFSTYGDSLSTGETTDASVYSWSIRNHVNNTNSIPITANGAELAGHFPGHTHPKNWTAEADILFELGAQATVANAELSFSIVERHEHTELDILVAGKPNAAKFVFSGTGLVRLEFTQTGINEYLNGAFQATRTYASVSWTPSDRISTIKFIGLHHDNGSINRSYIDNISFVAIPEPSTIILTSLMACGLGIRSRNGLRS